MIDKVQGRIIRGVGGAYWIAATGETPVAGKPRGLFRHKGVSPLPGDRVDAVASGDSDFPLEITAIHPRSNQLPRPACANIDRLYLVFSCTNPAPDLYLLDKLMVLCGLSNIQPTIIWTKEDLVSHELDGLIDQYSGSGIEQLSSSPDNWPETLNEAKQDELLVLAGPSGVGKSTLLNALLGTEQMRTAAVSEKTQRGRHTTRHMELFPYYAGWLADTPGFTSLDLDQLGILPEEIEAGYPEFDNANCKFQPCSHLHEPGCAVQNLISEQPELVPRYNRYRDLRQVLEQAQPHELRRARERQERSLYTIESEADRREEKEN